MSQFSIQNLKLEVRLSGSTSWINSLGERVTKQVNHEYIKEFTGGTSGNGSMDVLFEDSSDSLAAAPHDVDLIGVKTADEAVIAAWAEAGLIWIENLSSTANDTLEIGNGGANAVNGTKAGWGSDVDKNLIGPNGLFLLVSPHDGQGVQLAAGTGDILRLQPNALTFAVKQVTAGRSV